MDLVGGLGQTLGIEILELSTERARARMPVSPAHLQPLGFLHGGASIALAEHLASFAAHLHVPEGHAAFGLEVNASHLRKKRSGEVYAEARPLKIGRRIQVWQVEIQDEEGKLISVARVTLAVVPLDTREKEA